MLDTKESVEFYVLEQTKLGGISYILVTDAEEGDGEALILKETAENSDRKESVYEILNSINPSQNKFWDKIKE